MHLQRSAGDLRIGSAPTRTISLLLLVYGIPLLLILITRLPLMPKHLYDFDSVNLALAIREFDPVYHQPQPPGYPFFVAESRLAMQFLRTPEEVFHVLAILAGAVALGSLYLLGRKMFSAGVGLAAALLLFFNPVFWYTGLTSALRLHAAVISILAAFFCWRALSGRKAYFYAASLVLGLGGGFRPEATLTLLPLWVWCAWKLCDRRIVAKGFGLMAAGNLLWAMPIIWAYGGLGETWNSLWNYLMYHSQSRAALEGGPVFPWRRMIGRAILWNGMGAIPLLLLVPWSWRSLPGLPDRRLRFQFLSVWFLPHLLLSALVHITSPGHVMTTLPAICLAAGLVVDEFLHGAQKAAEWKRVTAIWMVLILWNVGFFFWPRTIPEASSSTEFRGWASVRDAFLIGSFETSYAQIRHRDNRTALAISQIERLKADADRPVLLIWLDDEIPVWRKVCYYFPSDPLYEIVKESERETSGIGARQWQGNTLTAVYQAGESIRLPIPFNARLIWLMPLASVARLNTSASIESAPPVHYADISPDSIPIQLGQFEFHSE